MSGAAGFARRTFKRMETTMIWCAPKERPITLGATHALRLEVTAPIEDLVLPDLLERLWCDVTVAGEPLGSLQLPVCDGVVPACVLKDAIADQFGWAILGRFFADSIYPTLQ